MGPLDPTAYDPTFKVAGQECSSTNEGRYVNIIESVLNHPAHVDGLVRKGDPCVTFELCGVSMKSASSVDDVITIDTEGIWWLEVECFYLGMDMAVGQRVYIDLGTAVLSDDITGMPFGWALDSISNGQAKLIAVKVHSTEWLFWVFWWFMQGP